MIRRLWARWLLVDWTGPLTAGPRFNAGGFVPRPRMVWLDDGFGAGPRSIP